MASLLRGTQYVSGTCAQPSQQDSQGGRPDVAIVGLVLTSYDRLPERWRTLMPLTSLLVVDHTVVDG